MLMGLYYYAENIMTGQFPANYKKGVENLMYVNAGQTVLNENGLMTSHGFAKKKVRNFSKNQIKGIVKKFKYKKFDHFAFVSRDQLIHFSVINMNYIYNLSISVYDKKSNKK